MGRKPLNGKAYGHIPHLLGSRREPGDHKCSEGQARIATEKIRDKHDTIVVQQKVDGSCICVANVNGQIVPLTRAGYVANTSPFEQHQLFYDWVMSQQKYERFYGLLKPGERLWGEWLAQMVLCMSYRMNLL